MLILVVWVIDGVKSVVELLDTLPVMLRLDETLVLWKGEVDADITELELRDIVLVAV